MRPLLIVLAGGLLFVTIPAGAQMPGMGQAPAGQMPGMGMTGGGSTGMGGMGCCCSGGGVQVGGATGGMGTGAQTAPPLIGHLLQQRQSLGLSPEQVKTLQTLHSEALKEGLRNSTEIQIAEMELNMLLTEQRVDLAKVEAQIKALESLRSKGRLSEVRALAQARALLTAEQQQKLQLAQPMSPMGGSMGPTGRGGAGAPGAGPTGSG